MSYELCYHGEEGVVKVPPHADGGTVKFVQADDGTIVPGDDAELNITGNYSSIFPIRGLDGKVGEEVLDELEDAVKILGTERDEDYWAKTPGNVGYTLSILVGWIKLHPKAVFSIY